MSKKSFKSDNYLYSWHLNQHLLLKKLLYSSIILYRIYHYCIWIFQEEFKDFDLSSVVDYIKVGVEAIIEDEVTSRFEAEELKNWNLLIRTNRHYEFISLKLTILWICGFFLRYFFLFPLRVLICCFGVSFHIFKLTNVI